MATPAAQACLIDDLNAAVKAYNKGSPTTLMRLFQVLPQMGQEVVRSPLLFGIIGVGRAMDGKPDQWRASELLGKLTGANIGAVGSDYGKWDAYAQQRLQGELEKEREAAEERENQNQSPAADENSNK